MKTTGFEINHFLPAQYKKFNQEHWVQKSQNNWKKKFQLDKIKWICYANAKKKTRTQYVPSTSTAIRLNISIV